jgi:DNA-binding transcriptional ArsR family regulator
MAENDPKAMLYEQFARIGKVLGNPRRLELLHLLGQGERSVESLALACGLGLTTASAHLQVLRQARLVETRRDGVKVFYRIADDTVYRLLLALQDVGRSRLAEVQQIARDYFEARDELQPISKTRCRTDSARGRRRPGRTTRRRVPRSHRRRSPSAEELVPKLGTCPRREIAAYCRGRYRPRAQALEVLRDNGRRARRREDGYKA